MPLQKLSEIEAKLEIDYIDIKHRYIKLKRCKYALLILKTSLISLSIGLSFVNPLMMITSSLVPIIDSTLLITEKDKKVCDLKLQKDIINQIIKEIEIKKYTFKDDNEVEKYIIQVYRKIHTFLETNEFSFVSVVYVLIFNALVVVVLNKEFYFTSCNSIILFT